MLTADGAKRWDEDEGKVVAELRVKWRRAGSNEGVRWCSPSRPSPLWPPREAPFSSAAACGSRAEETLRGRQKFYDEHSRGQFTIQEL